MEVELTGLCRVKTKVLQKKLTKELSRTDQHITFVLVLLP